MKKIYTLLALLCLLANPIFSQKTVRKKLHEAQKAEQIGDLRRADSLAAAVLKKPFLSKKWKNQARLELGFYKTQLGEYAAAEPLLFAAHSFFKQKQGADAANFATAADRLGLFFLEQKKYEKALPFYQTAWQIRKSERFLKNTKPENLPTRKTQIGESLEHLGEFFLEIEQFDTAQIFFLEGKKYLPPDHFLQSHFDLQLGRIALVLTHFDQAETHFFNSKNLQEKLKLTRHPHFAKTLGMLANLFDELGQLPRASHFYKKTLAATEASVGSVHPDFAMHLNNLGVIFEKRQQLDSAASCYQTAGQVFKKLGRTMDYLNTAQNLGVLEKSRKNFAAATQIFEQSRQDWATHSSTATHDYAWILYHLSSTLSLQKDSSGWQRANDLAADALQIFVATRSEQHVDLPYFLTNLALVAERTARTDAAAATFQKLAAHVGRQAREIFPLFSEEERLLFYQNSLLFFRQFVFDFGAKNAGRIEREMLELDQNLKGLALEISRENRLAAAVATDSTLANDFENWKKASQQIQFFCFSDEATTASSASKLDSLREQADFFEKRISRKIEAGKTPAPPENSMKILPEKLPFDAAAINFFKSKNQYFALVHTADTLATIRLDSVEAIDQFLLDDPAAFSSYLRNEVQRRHFSQRIWQPIEPFLKNVHSVFVSPTGNLHRAAFHVLTDAAGDFLLKKYEISVCLAPIFSKNSMQLDFQKQKIEVFGGAFFDEKQAKKFASPIEKPSEGERGKSFNFLSGSRAEADSLAIFFELNGWKVEKHTGFEASETNFREVEKRQPEILHLATHGFFLPKTEGGKSNTLENRVRAAESPLVRSGIALARANENWKSETPAAADSDGIVSALEIGAMDFSGVRLVVLSACETGRGDTDDAEGVFGLQRSLRQAGAGALLVSLWKVPDATTARLMLLFYENLLKNGEPREALRLAQLSMFLAGEEVYFWAGFIVLD